MGKAGNAGSFSFVGFEILNEDIQIQVPKGEVFANGRKYTNSALTASDYNTGFDGAPVLNGRGGRVVEYLTPEGDFGKAIQQTDASQLNLSAADHSNEEVIRRINWREFGANRGDDFSTLAAGTSSRAFTLDDGTTTLVGANVNNSAATPTSPTSVYLITNSVSHLTITFVGTGLDVTWSGASNGTNTNADAHEVFVNDSSIGNWETVEASAGKLKYKTLVSGLPYGTNTVSIKRNVPTSWSLGIQDFIVQGPKKPSIPADAAELQEYYLMADFIANTTAGGFTSSTGTLMKSCTRETSYIGGSWTGLGFVQVSDRKTGWAIRPNIPDANHSFGTTFWGIGIDIRHPSSVGMDGNLLIEIDIHDGSGWQTFNDTHPDATVAASAAAATYYGPGDGGFNTTTGELDQVTASGSIGNGVIFKNLALGTYSIRGRSQDGSGQPHFEAWDIITPIHYPDTKIGSLSMGPSIKLHEETSTSGIDLSKAKALLVLNMQTNEIEFSHNVAATVDISTGRFNVYWEKPFKDRNYVTVAMAEIGSGNRSYVVVPQDSKYASYCDFIIHESGIGDRDQRLNVAVFGELADEGDE
jgi:hypothetical protein